MIEAEPLSDLHSSKPEIFAQMIAEYYPNVPKIELNARAPRDGWARWGDEAPDEDDIPPEFAKAAE